MTGLEVALWLGLGAYPVLFLKTHLLSCVVILPSPLQDGSCFHV